MTPQAQRLCIGLFGPMNSGKSSLFNALLESEAAIVSSVAGTTGDVSRRSLEWPGLGAVSLLDSAGFDEEADLGKQRGAAAHRALASCDLAVFVLDRAEVAGLEASDEPVWFRLYRKWLLDAENLDIPCLLFLNKADQAAPVRPDQLKRLQVKEGETVLSGSVLQAQGLSELRQRITQVLQDCEADPPLTEGLADPGDLVVLVMPQDPAAPKTRLIQAQSQCIRELLDRGIMSLCVRPEELSASLDRLRETPRLIICDSRVFAEVRQSGRGLPICSFSVLFARAKGDLAYYQAGLERLHQLRPGDRILIAEACAHQALQEDIGRVRLPALLQKRYGDLQIDVYGAASFPEDLSPYRLIIHCGACLASRRAMQSRIRQAKAQGIPMSNYGLVLADLQGVSVLQ